MCLFPYNNMNENSKAYKYGITKFECGSCPECLQKKSRVWALKCSMEAKVSQGMMLTLTYDTYIYDNKGNVIGEQLPSSDVRVNKRDLQNFFKRLRYYFPDKKLSYLATAEYGRRTHRPHYHCLIFGLVFDDLREYKKSKRGNKIYRSRTLEKIWQGGKTHKGGICTVDCVNLSAKTARYCTKYCAKDSGVDDTFMLFSRGIGDNQLLEKFNGKSYWIDGREYPIPKRIWTKYIESKYNIVGYSKYRNFDKDIETKIPKKLLELNKKNRAKKHFRFMCSVSPSLTVQEKRFNHKKIVMIKNKYSLRSELVRFNRSYEKRSIFSNIRDNDSIYKRYVSYWRKKASVYEKYRPTVQDRILALPDNKYRSYKNQALCTLHKIYEGVGYIPPRSNSRAVLRRWLKEQGVLSKGGTLLGEFGMPKFHLSPRPRHYTTNDRKLIVKNKKIVFLRQFSLTEEQKLAKECPF